MGDILRIGNASTLSPQKPCALPIRRISPIYCDPVGECPMSNDQCLKHDACPVTEHDDVASCCPDYFSHWDLDIRHCTHTCMTPVRKRTGDGVRPTHLR